MARNFPVVTISSTAFQQLSSTKRQLQRAKGFSSLKDTEVPALQTYAKATSNPARIMASKTFLNELTQLIGMLNIFLNRRNAKTPNTGQSRAREGNHEVELLEMEAANLADCSIRIATT